MLLNQRGKKSVVFSFLQCRRRVYIPVRGLIRMRDSIKREEDGKTTAISMMPFYGADLPAFYYAILPLS
jgi:hypothetical protein